MFACPKVIKFIWNDETEGKGGRVNQKIQPFKNRKKIHFK